MKKLLIALTALVLVGLSILFIRKQKKSTARYTIGILQTASHPALDAARDGFIETLKNKLGSEVEFITQNAQGSVAQAHALAQQFHANKNINSFFAIATPAAQALNSVETKRPIIIAAVTDPNSLGLIHPRTNVSGTKDLIDVKAEIDTLTKLLPNAKTVGLVYTAGEVNSLALVKLMRKELERRGLQAIDFAISSETDLQPTVELAARKSDVILAPTDNTVASAISLISSLALKHKKPLIVSDNMLVQFGALAAQGVDYKASGVQAGEIAYQIVTQNKKPFELPVEQATSEQIVINKATLEALGLVIPADIQAQVVLV